ncbi:uncharacterized protein LOC127863221 [Dreissena polymorpha]|nr:uncharacterized protein LOC127863221 [Dreissena polymorpha]
MADLLHVSDSSVKRRLRSFGLKLRQTYSVLSNNALDDLVGEVTQGNPSLGQRMVQGLLQSRGHRVQRQRVADSLIRVDAAAVALRWCHSIRRRVYKVAAPNSLWHIDGNHKLISFNTVFYILTRSTASVNGVKLQPNDVLMWLTGSVGFHKVIDVEFGDTLRVNTCALVLTLAEVPREVEDVVQHYSELLINSQTFQAE